MRSSKQRSRNKQNRNTRPTGGNIINRVFDSSGPDGKVRGTPAQIIEKYGQLHRDAQLSGDRVNAENFAQHAEHYTRMLAEATREVDRAREEQETFARERQTERDRQMESQRDRDRERAARQRPQEESATVEGQPQFRSEPRADPRPERQEPRQSDPRSEPRPFEPRHAEARQTESRQTESRQTEPRQAEPRYAEPRHSEPRQAEVRNSEGRAHDLAGASFLAQPLFPTLVSDPDDDAAEDAGLVDTPEERRAEAPPTRGERPRRDDRRPAREERRPDDAPVADAPVAAVDDAARADKPRRARKPRLARPETADVAPDTAE